MAENRRRWQRRRAGAEPAALVAALVAALLTATAPAALGDDDLDLREQQAFRAAVERVMPSVVRIETVGGLERVGKLILGMGPTTGLVVAPDGYLVSSAFNFAHRPDSILVQLPDGTRKPARLVASDHNRMLVLLKIDVDRPLPVAETVPHSQMRVGQWAIAVGRTFETSQANLSVGVLSALNRIWGKAIQTDAAVSPNNYGGPLIDVHGRVLGVLAPLSPQGAKEVAGMEWYDSGIGFAVPAETIQQILPKLKQGSDLWPGVIGIQFAGRSLFTSEPVLASCRPNSPAHRAGLKAGDRIVEIEGRKVTLAAQVKEEISRRYAGDKLRVVVVRKNQRSQHDVDLVQKLPPYEHPFLGVLPMRGDRFQGTKQAKTFAGVALRYVYPESPAARAAIVSGDVLESLAGEKVADANQAREKLSDRLPGERIEIGLRRGNQAVRARVQLGRLPESAPPASLPPAWPAVSAAKDKRPKVGRIALKVPEFENASWAYVPENYHPSVAHGVVIWLHGREADHEKTLLARWKNHCERDHLILLVPQSAEPTRWEPKEAALIIRLLAEVAASYQVDPWRTVTFGREEGGSLGYVAAFAARGFIHGVATIDSSLRTTAPENEPGHRLAFYLAKAAVSPGGSQTDDAVSRLRELKYPVTVKSLDQKLRDFTPEELSELLRWIDTLDRI